MQSPVLSGRLYGLFELRRVSRAEFFLAPLPACGTSVDTVVLPQPRRVDTDWLWARTHFTLPDADQLSKTLEKNIITLYFCRNFHFRRAA